MRVNSRRTKGNNLIAIASLLHRYEGNIKFVYIDPPYNTGGAANTFAYNNTFNHKNIIDPVAAVVATTAAVVIKESLSGGSKSNISSYKDDDDYDYSTYPSLEEPSEEQSTAIVQQDGIIDRSSPSEHTVSAHRQRYNGEWRDKAPYTRGKNSDE